MDVRVDHRSPIPIRLQLVEQLKHFIEGEGFPRDQALPSIRELAGFLGINPNTVARAGEDLYAKELEAQLPIQVHKVLPGELGAYAAARGQCGQAPPVGVESANRW